jgi:hypothetical protein
MEDPMRSRALAGIAFFASLTSISVGALGQETKPAEPPAPPPAAPAPAAPTSPSPATPPPAAELPPLPPEPPPFGVSNDVALNPVTEEPAVGAPYKRRLVFEASLGYTSGGSVKHPELADNGFSGEMLELAGGVELSPKWRLLLAFTSFQSKLERVGSSNMFRSASGTLRGGAGYQPLAGCVDCTTAGGGGGVVDKQPLHLDTLGPRLDYLPFGADSVYLGVTAGAAMVQDLSFRGGVAVAARAGFEWRPYSSLGLSLEAGAHGQVYSDSSAVLPYAAVVMNLLAPPPPISTTMTVTEPPTTTPPPAPPSSTPLPPPPPPYK